VLLGDLRERLLRPLDLVGGGVGPGVAGAQEPGQRLVRLVEVGEQRVEAEAALEVARRALLLRVGGHERGVEVDRDPFRFHAELPCPLARPGTGAPQALQQVRVAGDPVDYPERRRVGGHLAEERLLVTHRAQVREAVAAVGEHHREVAHDAAGIAPRAALALPRKPNRQRPRQPRLVRHLRQQRAARMRHQPRSVRRDFYGETAAITLHPQGDPPELGNRASTTQRLPAQPDKTAPRNPRGAAASCTIRAKRSHPALKAARLAAALSVLSASRTRAGRVKMGEDSVVACDADLLPWCL
jgi:hypothetical protein